MTGRSTRRPHRLPPITFACTMLLVTACLAAPSGSVPPSGVVPGAPESGLSLADATLAYGAGPTSDPAVTYQPDVVVVGGGPVVIRWASDDALTWAIDSRAPHVRDLAEGSVMFLTSVAVGRVAHVEDDGDARVVTIAPVELTDLVRDGDLEVDQAMALDSAVYHQLPADFPAMDGIDTEQTPGPDAATPADRATTVKLPPLRFVAAHPGDVAVDTTVGGRLTKPLGTCTKIGLGDWAIEYCAPLNGGGVDVGIESSPAEHLKLSLSLKIEASNLHLQAGETIKDGKLIRSGGLLTGLTGFGISFSGGAANGAADNAKFTIEIPFEVETPSVVIAGLPFKMLIEGKLLLDTAFGGKNTTMLADGHYSLSGPLGIVDGKPVIPTLTVTKSMLESLRGVTIGVSGLVFTAKLKYIAGLGVYGFAVGPQLTVTMSFGWSRGSVLGGALAQCNGVTLGIWVSAGAGLNLNAKKVAWLFGKDSFFSKYVKLEATLDLVQFQVFDRKAVSPNVPICTG